MKQPIIVDARGLACPQPVVKTKEALENHPGRAVEVLVDNRDSAENVSRFARSRGREVETDEEGATHRVFIRPGPESSGRTPVDEVEPASCAVTGQKLVVYVGADRMGRGSEELGKKLMRGFLRTWLDSPAKPWRMVFLNSGVHLTTIDEEAPEVLELLAERGVEILTCGTCLQHFGLEKELRVGKVTNMYEVVETLCSAGRVVSP